MKRVRADHRSLALAIAGEPFVPAERKDAQRNRARILAAARKLLGRKPISAICMDALADAAGVGKGTLYRRFKDRSSLCLALLDDAARALQEQTIAGFGLDRAASAETRLAVFVHALVAFTLDNAALLAEANAFMRDCRARFSHPARAWQGYELSRLLALVGAPAGDAMRRPPTSLAGAPSEPRRKRSAAEVALLTDWILALLDPDLFLWQLERGHDDALISRSLETFIARAIGLPLGSGGGLQGGHA